MGRTKQEVIHAHLEKEVITRNAARLAISRAEEVIRLSSLQVLESDSVIDDLLLDMADIMIAESPPTSTSSP